MSRLYDYQTLRAGEGETGWLYDYPTVGAGEGETI